VKTNHFQAGEGDTGRKAKVMMIPELSRRKSSCITLFITGEKRERNAQERRENREYSVTNFEKEVLLSRSKAGGKGRFHQKKRSNEPENKDLHGLSPPSSQHWKEGKRL